MEQVARDLRARLEAIPPVAADAALGIGLCLLALIEFHFFHQGLGAPPGLDRRNASIPFFTLPLAVRRSHPVICVVLQMVGAFLVYTQPPYTAIFADILGLYSLCVYGPSLWLAFAWLVGGVLALAIGLPGQVMQTPPFVEMILVGLVAWIGGLATRSRQVQARLLEERARRLETERDLAAQVAAADERARIARDLHDIVAHSVSLIVVQAGAARVVRGQPLRAVEALRQVEASGRQALDELRHLVGLLGKDDGSNLAPQPGLDQLEKLADTVRAAGLPVDVSITGPRRELPPGLELTAYRIVQEALTNTMKHAPGAAAHVRIDFRNGDLGVEVTDTGGGMPAVDAPSGGHGLTGMRERVAIYHGDLEAGPVPGGGYAVRVRLPVEPQ